eukprot:gene9598-12926_t
MKPHMNRLKSNCLYGKSDKKSKKISGSVAKPQPSSAVSAPRVSNQINIPIRQQIAWAKAYKRLINASSKQSSSPTKKFKKERGPKAEQEEYVEVNYVETKPPAIFVDGYNIIGRMNEENKNKQIDLSTARDCLISDLAVLRGATGWWIEVVFDAYKVSSPQKCYEIDNILVTYTSQSETADNFIERRFEELRSDGFTNMVVATDDNILRMIAGSKGAGFLTSSMLLEELRIAYRGWEIVEQELDNQMKLKKPTFADSLSQEMRDAIEMMKSSPSKS